MHFKEKPTSYENRIISQCIHAQFMSSQRMFSIFLRDVEIWIFFSIKAKQRDIFHIIDTEDVDEVTVSIDFLFFENPSCIFVFTKKSNMFCQ